MTMLSRKKRTFQAVDPATIKTPRALSIGLYAFTGQGKTESSLRLAHGIAKVTGRRVVFADCDNGRGQHFTVDGPTTTAMFPNVEYIDFLPPYNALDFVDLIEQYEHQPVILVIDNMSAEHEGEGGLLDTFEDAQGGEERKNARAWGIAKTPHKELVRVFPRVNRSLPMILTWRAQEKIDWNHKENGRSAPQSKGEMPIGSNDLPFTMTATYLLPAGSKGAPCLAPVEKGERLMTKIPRWFEGIIKPGEKFTEAHGEAMARWAFGTPSPETPGQRIIARLHAATSRAEVNAIATEATEQRSQIRKAEGDQIRKLLAEKREAFTAPTAEPTREPGED